MHSEKGGGGEGGGGVQGSGLQFEVIIFLEFRFSILLAQ